MTLSAKTILAGLAVAATVVGAAQAQERHKTTFNLSWLPQGSTSGVLVAIDKGHYAAEGLDVTAVRGFGGLRTVNEIDQGMFEFGYGNPDGIILNRSKGGKTKMIGSINAINPGGVCFVESRVNPKSVKDLKGMTLGAAAGTPVTTTFPALLALNGMPADHVKIVQLQGSVIYTALVNGTIDIYECWRGSGKQILEHQAKTANIKIGFLSYEDMGLHNYGSGVTVTEDTIAKRPQIVSKFLKATYRGYQDMMKNPAEGADITKKMFPESDRAVVLDQIVEINQLIKGPGYDERGIGWIDPARAKSTFDFVSKTMDVGSVKPEDTYTNQFITK